VTGAASPIRLRLLFYQENGDFAQLYQIGAWKSLAHPLAHQEQAGREFWQASVDLCVAAGGGIIPHHL